MECLWFSFSQLLQKELDEFRENWNTHYIRRSRHDTVPGRPDEHFYLPENVNAKDYLQIVDDEKYQDMLNYCHDYYEESSHQDYFNTIFTLGSFRKPESWNDALVLYRDLVDIAE